MKIDVIGAETVKVELTKEELGKYGMTFEELDGGRDGTRALLTELLEEVKKESGFEFEEGKLFVEAFEGQDGSVVLYISQVGLKTSRSEKVRTGARYRPVKTEQNALKTAVCEFDDFGQLYGFARTVLEDISQPVLESRLFSDTAEKYRLIVRYNGKPSRKLMGLLGEFSRGAGDILAGVTEEHCALLVPERALEIITGL